MTQMKVKSIVVEDSEKRHVCSLLYVCHFASYSSSLRPILQVMNLVQNRKNLFQAVEGGIEIETRAKG